jgi:tetratricopeptide (TPR) repeat protein
VRTLAMGVGVVALVGGAAALHRAYARAQARDACAEVAGAIGEVWSAEVRANVGHALLGSRVPHARSTARNVMPWLDGYAGAWADAATTACERGRAEVQARTFWCLEQRRIEMWALVNELGSGKGRAATHAVQAAARLSPVERCLDPLRSAAPSVEDRDAAVAVEAASARARVLRIVGGHEEGLHVAERALAQAEAGELAPLRAAARTEIGLLLETIGEAHEAETVLERAYLEALAVGSFDVAIAAADGLTSAVGRRQGRHEAGRRWWRRAQLLRASVPDRIGLRSAAGLDVLAAVHRASGRTNEARPLLERALALREQALHAAHPDLARTVDDLATVHFALGDVARARELYTRALELWQQALGPDHTRISLTLDRLAALDEPRTYEVPYALPLLERPEIILSLATRTIHLFDRVTGFSAIYPAAPGMLDAQGNSETPTGFFTTGGDLDDPWFYMERRYVLDWFGGFPFLRLTARNEAGQHTFGLHGPITFTCPDGAETCGQRQRRWFLENGYPSHGCVRMQAEDIIELFWSVREHPRVPVAIIGEPERDAAGELVDLGAEPELWREGEAIDYAECGPRPDPWHSTFRWPNDDC